MTITRAVEAGARAALTDLERKALELGPINGLIPGSNLWPLVEIKHDDGTMVPGDTIQALLHRGYLSAGLLPAPVVTDRGDTDLYSGDLECTHDITITAAGRAALRLKIEEMGR